MKTWHYLLPHFTQGIHQEPKLLPTIGPAHNFHVMVQAWGTQAGLMLAEVGGWVFSWGPHRLLSVLGFQPKLEVFHSGFYKNYITAETEQHKSNSVLGKKSSICPNNDQMVPTPRKKKGSRSYMHLIPCVTTRGRQVQHKSTTDLLQWPLEGPIFKTGYVCEGHNKRHVKMYVATDLLPQASDRCDPGSSPNHQIISCTRLNTVSPPTSLHPANSYLSETCECDHTWKRVFADVIS